jgi:23S rRNA (adenine2503-C2)-methyltransferase
MAAPASLPFIHDLTFGELEAHLGQRGEPSFRARQVWSHLYGRLATDPTQMSGLPAALVRHLASFSFTPLRLSNEWHSRDQRTLKLLFELHDGATVEAVLMDYDRRRTACISSQSGCGMGCVFCATGQMGLSRNLSSGEIVAQVLFLARPLAERAERITNIVVMGMGEPMQNYAAVLAAMDRLSDPGGFALGARRITISTVGLVPAIRRFADEHRQINLAVSLHAATDELRSRLLPINRRYPLDTLFEACRYYVSTTHRRLTFEWALIAGVNDMPEQANALAERCRGLLCHVNLIPLNPTLGYGGLPTSREVAEGFRSTLEAHGVPCTVRVRRGIEIEAGCGQLASQRVVATKSTPAA